MPSTDVLQNVNHRLKHINWQLRQCGRRLVSQRVGWRWLR